MYIFIIAFELFLVNGEYCDKLGQICFFVRVAENIENKNNADREADAVMHYFNWEDCS